jgi:PAS domain-containing protein
MMLAVLENLKEDPSLYVRKSVANNLNDISKDNPLVIIEVIRKWKGVHPYTDWILRHGSRTLIRIANPEVMKLFGYEESMDGALTTSATLHIDSSEIKLGESTELKYEINIRQGEPVHMRIEYGIDFVKARGKTSRKLFMLSDKTVPGGTCLEGSRMHRWKNLTTRKHYPGDHRVTLLINGCEVANTVMKLDV